MTPNPIGKVLSTLREHQVQCLLMGGQACVFYGAAEFSRDTDVALLAEPENLEHLQSAIRALRAEVIAVPPFELGYLHKGHAVHFRCAHPEAQDMRLDVMSVMRGLPDFPTLWLRRTTAQLEEGGCYELMSLPDLVIAKKTQRDKDWPMIRRLVEADCQRYWEKPTPEQVEFWFLQARTPELLKVLAGRFPEGWRRAVSSRELLSMLPSAPDVELEEALWAEEQLEREQDRSYWKPLREELESLRHRRDR